MCHVLRVVLLPKSRSLRMKTHFLVGSPWYTRRMKRLFIIVGLLIVFAVSASYGYNRTTKNPDPNHTHADFAVWYQGEQFDFSDQKYMTEELSAEQLAALAAQTGTGKDLETLKQYLHLHDGNGHVIHRHKPGLTLGDFFSTLIWRKPGDKRYVGNTFLVASDVVNDAYVPVRLFVNGKVNTQGSAYVFQDGDHLLITDAKDGPSYNTNFPS
jgi:hypothetical protein